MQFLNFRVDPEKAKSIFSKLEEIAPMTFGTFPLAFFKDPQKNIRIVAHWVPSGNSGLLFLGYSPSAQHAVEKLTRGLAPASGQITTSFLASLFENNSP